ncbi:crotonase/enoyl-CoA hydratase family protein [Marimonas sp. MJW-29]|uniref:Crotonase/enoyl-CoA hydratase family protein n=1 Tax=Sulfitobacter sediminis TaxID=3234186 RepID=A0ABV3RLA5_9RHOB
MEKSAGKSDLIVEIDGDIALLTFNRAPKRNAMSDALIHAIEAFFANPPEGVAAVILRGDGGHFSAGLDLDEHQHRSPEQTAAQSRKWHRITDLIEHGGLPVVAVMEGAVIGGGLEVATAAHVRIAEPSVRFQLPEGRRGIFVGGGATVRVGRLIGPDRMREMMLTGRSYGAEEGLALGLAHYAVGAGEGLPLARDLARKIADNAPYSNYLMINALGRIADMSRDDGFFMESLSAAVAQSTEGAMEGLRAFLEKREPNFRK